MKRAEKSKDSSGIISRLRGRFANSSQVCELSSFCLNLSSRLPAAPPETQLLSRGLKDNHIFDHRPAPTQKEGKKNGSILKNGDREVVKNYN